MRGEPLRSCPKPASRAKPPRGPHSTLRQRTPLTARPKAERKPRHANYVPNKPYQDFVRSRGCLLAGKPGHICGWVEFAHVGSRGAGHGDEGQGVPLCRMGHRESPLSLHNLGPTEFRKVWALENLAVIARRLWKEYQRGSFA